MKVNNRVFTILLMLLLVMIFLSSCSNSNSAIEYNDVWYFVAPVSESCWYNEKFSDAESVAYYHDTLNHVGIWRVWHSDIIVVIPDSEYIGVK